MMRSALILMRLAKKFRWKQELRKFRNNRISTVTILQDQVLILPNQ